MSDEEKLKKMLKIRVYLLAAMSYAAEYTEGYKEEIAILALLGPWTEREQELLGEIAEFDDDGDDEDDD